MQREEQASLSEDSGHEAFKHELNQTIDGFPETSNLPLFMVDVQLSPDRQERLVIYEGTSIERAIAEFVREQGVEEGEWGRRLGKLCEEMRNKL